ncbi:uncharacterized protein BP5553_04668 [Venustampulla echinocandica]|uniref:Uncharacterized protein n=1 Tax=Venustampulla echinocandica TaxID=2656787 RepID=A0A370TNY7_9HELO|nr:uncharacterized protein BP5553_04668 [Venustampulla echinocandica]RDL37235.1 hypothetical protein BP5553_04668 [Venustampulla echinocandica]
MATEYSIDVEATIQFTDPNDLAKTLRIFFNNATDRDSLSDHTVLITGFPIESFTIDDDEPSPIPQTRKALYLEDSSILVLTMPGRPHEAVARLFSGQLDIKLANMNCQDDIIPGGGVTTSIGQIQKEPDSSWGPLGADYLTCVLESGVSESRRALARDAKIWLEHYDSHTTQVVTVWICRRRPDIVFTVWKRAQDHPPRAVVDQEVHIKLEEGRPMADGQLRLSFEKFFERRPRPGTAEGDFVFSARELGRVARMVWIQMGFTVQ